MEKPGNIRLQYEINGEGLEITCIVCGTYSGGSKLAKEKGNGTKIPAQVLAETPYVCRCGVKYSTNLTASHWHLFVSIPKGLINQEALEAKLKSKSDLLGDTKHPKHCDCPECDDGQYQ
jgi:hypothetical protein